MPYLWYCLSYHTKTTIRREAYLSFMIIPHSQLTKQSILQTGRSPPATRFMTDKPTTEAGGKAIDRPDFYSLKEVRSP